MSIKSNLQALQIVIIAPIKPQKINAEWLSEKKLISAEAAATVKVDLSHEQISIFHIQNTDFHIEQNKFLAATSDQTNFEPLRDLVLGTLNNIDLVPTQLGINFVAHLDVGNNERWHDIGHKLAPKEHWADVMAKPGLRSISMEGKNPLDKPGFTLIKLEPSRRISHGVYIEVNYNFRIDDQKDSALAKQILINNYQDLVSHASSAMEKLVTVGTK